MELNRSSLQALYRGFNTLFNSAFSNTPSDWRSVAMEVPSSTSEETYAWLGLTTRFREWLGDRVIQNLKSHGYTIKNKSFESTVGVNRDNIEDDQIGVYSPIFQQLGQDAKTHPDELVFALLKAGFDTACYDGQYFFDSDHPVVQADGTTTSVSNVQSGSSSPWFLLDASKAMRPVIFQKRRDYNFVAMDRDDDPNVFHKKELLYGVDARVNVGFGLWQLAFGSKATLDVTNYAAARAALMALKGDNGKPLGVRPSLLVCAPANEKAALEVLEAERLANGATNVYRGTAKLLVSPWLA